MTVGRAREGQLSEGKGERNRHTPPSRFSHREGKKISLTHQTGEELRRGLTVQSPSAVNSKKRKEWERISEKGGL